MAKKSKAVKHLINRIDLYDNSMMWSGWVREFGPLTETQMSGAAGRDVFTGEQLPYGWIWPLRARWTYCGIRFTEARGTVRFSKATCALCLVEWDRWESFK